MFRNRLTSCWAAWSLVLLIGVMAGCVDRQAAMALGKQGAAAAALGEASLTPLADNMDVFLGNLYLQAGLIGSPEPTTDIIDSVTEIKQLLAARAHMFADLGKWYESFYELASYDASKDTAGAAGAAVDSCNVFAAARKLTPLTADEKDAIVQLAGRGAALCQDLKIRENSQAIRMLLEHIIKTMENEDTDYLTFDKTAAMSATKVADKLFDLGVGRPHPILRPAIERAGLEYDAKQVTDLLDKQLAATTGDSKDKPSATGQGKSSDTTPAKKSAETIRDGVRKYVEGMRDISQRRRKSVIGKTVAALKTLRNAHEQLERGDPPDVAAVVSAVTELRTYAELLAKASR